MMKLRSVLNVWTLAAVISMMHGMLSSASATVTITKAPATLTALKPGVTGTVLFFIAHDCPISNGYAPEMNRLDLAYSTRGIAFYLIYAEKDFSPTQARAHLQEYSYRFPALLDSQLSLARSAHVTVTPEAVLLDPSGRIEYHGAIDNLYADFGVKRQRATQFPLRMALDAVIAKKPVPATDVKAVGCFLSTN